MDINIFGLDTPPQQRMLTIRNANFTTITNRQITQITHLFRQDNTEDAPKKGALGHKEVTIIIDEKLIKKFIPL